MWYFPFSTFEVGQGNFSATQLSYQVKVMVQKIEIKSIGILLYPFVFTARRIVGFKAGMLCIYLQRGN